MKITYIITRSDVIGGANVHLLDLIPCIHKKGYDVELLIGGQGVVYINALNLKIPTVSIKNLIRNINPKKDFLAYKEIINHIKKSKPDLIHLHSSKAGILGRLVAKKTKTPVIFTAHGWAFTDGVSKSKQFVYKKIEQFFASYANKIITVSEYDKRLAIENKVGNSKKIVTIHNGIPYKEDLNNYKKTKILEHSTCRIIMVARFDEPKDQSSLIRALSMIKEYDWSLSLVGDGPLLTSCKQLTIENGLEGKIHFLGQRNDVEQLLSQSDIFVLTSNWEGFPLSILEAMRASLPVIASDVGGVSEAVSHGQNGFLIPRGDEIRLAQKIKLLINNRELRELYGQIGRKKFLKEFTLEKMVQKTINVYHSILK